MYLTKFFLSFELHNSNIYCGLSSSCCISIDSIIFFGDNIQHAGTPLQEWCIYSKDLSYYFTHQTLLFRDLYPKNINLTFNTDAEVSVCLGLNSIICLTDVNSSRVLRQCQREIGACYSEVYKTKCKDILVLIIFVLLGTRSRRITCTIYILYMALWLIYLYLLKFIFCKFFYLSIFCHICCIVLKFQYLYCVWPIPRVSRITSMNTHNNKLILVSRLLLVLIYFILNDLFMSSVELAVWNSSIISNLLVWHYISVSIYSNNDKW